MELHAKILAGNVALPLLVVLPSLGCDVEQLWRPVADTFGRRFHVVGVDLPGHGGSAAARGFSMRDLAGAVLKVVTPFAQGRPFACAGVSIGGALVQELALLAPTEVSQIVVLNSASKIGTAEAWLDRAALVRADGTGALREGSAARWFAAGFIPAHPALASAMLDHLEGCDDDSYAALCEALAGFDLRADIAAIRQPLLVIGGAEDQATPPASQEALAQAVSGAALHILPRVAHLAPIEAPDQVADLLQEFLTTRT